MNMRRSFRAAVSRGARLQATRLLEVTLLATGLLPILALASGAALAAPGGETGQDFTTTGSGRDNVVVHFLTQPAGNLRWVLKVGSENEQTMTGFYSLTVPVGTQIKVRAAAGQSVGSDLYRFDSWWHTTFQNPNPSPVYNLTYEFQALPDDPAVYLCCCSLDPEVTEPSGGSSVPIGSPLTITWNADWEGYCVNPNPPEFLASIKVSLERFGEDPIGELLATLPPDASSYTWPAVTGPADSHCRITVAYYTIASTWLPEAWTRSGEFTIREVTPPHLTSPDGGQLFLTGNELGVTWQGDALGTWAVDLQRTPGAAWETLVSNLPASATSWTWSDVTGPRTETARIRVRQTVAGQTFEDAGNGTFWIDLQASYAPSNETCFATSQFRSMQWENNTPWAIGTEVHYRTQSTDWTRVGCVEMPSTSYIMEGCGAPPIIPCPWEGDPGASSGILPPPGGGRMDEYFRLAAVVTTRGIPAHAWAYGEEELLCPCEPCEMWIEQPQTGDILYKGTNEVVSILTGPNFCDPAVVFLSVDNGDTWTELGWLNCESSYPLERCTLDWSVTQGPSSSCYVRVITSAGGPIQTYSQGPFWILATPPPGGKPGEPGSQGGGLGKNPPGASMPTRLTLQCENPVSVDGKVELALPSETHVRLTVLDVHGRQIAVLKDGALSAGYHTLPWRELSGGSRPLPTGLYLLRLETEDGAMTNKVMILK